MGDEDLTGYPFTKQTRGMELGLRETGGHGHSRTSQSLDPLKYDPSILGRGDLDSWELSEAIILRSRGKKGARCTATHISQSIGKGGPVSGRWLSRHFLRTGEFMLYYIITTKCRE